MRTGLALAKEKELEHVLVFLPGYPILLYPLVDLIVDALRLCFEVKTGSAVLSGLIGRRSEGNGEGVIGVRGLAHETMFGRER